MAKKINCEERKKERNSVGPKLVKASYGSVSGFAFEMPQSTEE